jgi:drug/metabolite transporter (DMT)-like permease
MSTRVAEPLRRDVTDDRARLRTLRLVGVACGFAAGAWLGAAEAPTKLVTLGISPVVISLIMVIGVFLARWSLPALIQGTTALGFDVRHAPHLIVWAILAGCLWAVANTLTVFAIRDIGLSIAFPLWNSNSLLGIAWGIIFFRELRRAGWQRWVGVLGGAVVMFIGATLLASASAAQAPAEHPLRGFAAALAAGAMWGTMYIPYRKAYLSGMTPLSFITFFTIGELGMMSVLAISGEGGIAPLLHAISGARDVLFWLLLGGFVWVIGDLFQQYAAKYIGISRGIPLSNTNQLWGLLWGVLVFGELRHASSHVLTQVVAGSVVMALGAAAIALSYAPDAEQTSWREAAAREIERYGIDPEYVRARMLGENTGANTRRTPLDWILLAGTVAVFLAVGSFARRPEIAVDWTWVAVLGIASLALLVVCGVALWRTTRFS